MQKKHHIAYGLHYQVCSYKWDGRKSSCELYIIVKIYKPVANNFIYYTIVKVQLGFAIMPSSLIDKVSF
jgi:hypothetical protein